MLPRQPHPSATHNGPQPHGARDLRAPIGARVRDGFEILNTPFRHLQDALRFTRSEARAALHMESVAGRGTPIVVYSAPKTASTSVAAALDRTPGIATIKVHFLQPAHFWAGPLQQKVAPNGLLRHRAIAQRPARRILVNSNEPLRMVSVIREPIGFNLSNYTYFGRAYWMRTFWRSAPFLPTDRILRHFLDTFPHASSSLWWEHEFARTTGIDVGREAFDAERGWQRYQHGRFDCLVIRADITDSAKQDALRGWAGFDVAAVERENANDTQAAPGVYNRLKEAIRDEPAYVERMLALPSMRTFYSDAQRMAIRDRWLG